MQFYILLTLLPLLAIGIRGVDRPATAASSPMEPAVTASLRVADPNPSLRTNEVEVRTFGQEFGVGYVSDTLPGYFLSKLAESGTGSKNYVASCTIVITNTMTKYTLINPTVFLSRGSTRDPSPYKIEGSPDGSKTRSMVFIADDKLLRFSMVSKGVLIYEILNTANIKDRKYFSIAWKVEKNKKLDVVEGSGTNTFTIKFVRKSTTTIGKPYLERWIEENPPNRATGGGYVHMVDDAFLVRAHITNSPYAELIVNIENAHASDVRSEVKRSLAEAFALNLASSLAGYLTTTTLSYLPISGHAMVVTVVNDLKAAPLEDPKWHLRSVMISDHIPFKIGPQEEKQITFSAPFGYGETFLDQFKSAVVVLTFRIKMFDRRIGLAIWRRHNEYSTFLVEHKLENIANGKAKIEKLKAEAFQKYMCTDVFLYNTSTGKKKITLKAIMGDSSESGMKVHISERAVGRFETVYSGFHDCFRQTYSAVL